MGILRQWVSRYERVRPGGARPEHLSFSWLEGTGCQNVVMDRALFFFVLFNKQRCAPTDGRRLSYGVGILDPTTLA